MAGHHAEGMGPVVEQEDRCERVRHAGRGGDAEGAGHVQDQGRARAVSLVGKQRGQRLRRVLADVHGHAVHGP